MDRLCARCVYDRQVLQGASHLVQPSVLDVQNCRLTGDIHDQVLPGLPLADLCSAPNHIFVLYRPVKPDNPGV